MFVQLKTFGYHFHLSDRFPQVEVVIILPNNPSAVQPMDTGLTAKITAHFCARILLHAMEAMG